MNLNMNRFKIQVEPKAYALEGYKPEEANKLCFHISILV